RRIESAAGRERSGEKAQRGESAAGRERSAERAQRGESAAGRERGGESARERGTRHRQRSASARQERDVIEKRAVANRVSPSSTTKKSAAKERETAIDISTRLTY
ncbi:MAG: hypothetical protein BJ554DRAFT_2166, partial [Olpidium bornovanus]